MAAPRLPFAAITLVALSFAGCARAPAPAPPSATWIAAHAMPAFDPDDAPDALRAALERLLSRGLVERDSSGRIVPVLADSIGCSADSLTWTLRLRAGLRFTDGKAVTSAHVREALTGGLAREDQATRAWLLAALRGVARVRPGKPLPELGIETPDARTIVLRLERPDRRLLEKLAVPGVTAPFRRRRGSWSDAVGVGPYRMLASDGTRGLTFVAAAPVAGVSARVDTLRVRFVTGAPRVRNLMRSAHADLVWPLPPGLLGQPLPEGWSLRRQAAEPARRLLLVLRADMPPLTKRAAREAFAHALHRDDLLAALGARGEPLRRWLPGARTDYEWPRIEAPAERAARHAREVHGRDVRPAHDERPESYHVALAYDADLAGAEIALVLQGLWARAGLDAELRPLRGEAALAEALGASAAQAQIVESQALLPGGEAELALLVLPLRGPAVGGYRTGWRTREFDRWVAQGQADPGFDPDAVQAVLSQDRIVLPVAGLPWLMAVRAGAPVPGVHPAHGADWTLLGKPAHGARSR